MAKYKQECIFGIRAVIEAIQQEKEIDKVMLKQGVRGELFQQLFSLIRERNIPFQYVPEDVFKPFADRNHQGVLADITCSLSGSDRSVGWSRSGGTGTFCIDPGPGNRCP